MDSFVDVVNQLNGSYQAGNRVHQSTDQMKKSNKKAL